MSREEWQEYYGDGFKSVKALTEAEPNELVPAMMQEQSRKTYLQGEAADKLKAKLLEKLRWSC